MSAPIMLGSRFACPICGVTGAWRLVGRDGVESRSCRDHVGEVAVQIPTDGFTPILLIPVFPGGER